MTDAELEALFADAESDRVEREEALTHPDRVKQAIAAFANDLPHSGLPGRSWLRTIGARNNSFKR